MADYNGLKMLNSPIEEIKNRLDLVEVVRGYLKLQKTGANYRAVCPFHSEKKPSFFVSPARQLWKCFGCGKSGDMFSFIKEIEGVEFGDALRILAQKAGVELKRQDPKIKSERKRLYEICDLACLFFEKQLDSGIVGKEAKQYLLSRGVREENIKKWRLGYSPDTWQGLSDFLVGRGYKRDEIERAGLALKSEKNASHYDRFRGRIMFPVLDFNSQVIGFGARVFKEEKNPGQQQTAKYINTPATILYDKSRVLYGLNKGGIQIRKKDACVLVEGYMDVITAHQAGFENVVAASGTALTPFQLNIIKRYSENLFLSFDMDIAGDTATKRGIDLAQSLGFNISIVTMPEDCDPADVIQKDPKLWEDSIAKAKTIHDFYFESALSRFNKNTLEGKKSISKTLLPIIKKISNKIERSLWVKDLADVLDLKEDDILAELQKILQKEESRPVSSTAPQTGDKEIAYFWGSPGPKSRKEMLEEYLGALSLKQPENVNCIESGDFDILSLAFSQLIGHIKKSGQNPRDNCPKDLALCLDHLILKSEMLNFDSSADIKKEFLCCLKEIRTIGVKKRLDEISRQIKQAEKEKDIIKIQKLVEDFNMCSKSKNKLESA